MVTETAKSYEIPKIEIVHKWGFTDEMLDKMSDLRITMEGACACSCSCSCSCSGSSMFEQIAAMQMISADVACVCACAGSCMCYCECGGSSPMFENFLRRIAKS